MKTLLTLLLCLAALVASAQKKERLTYAALPVDSTTHLVRFTGVVPVSGATKEQLYLRAKEWAARSFVDNKVAARMDDKEAGTYIARGILIKPNTAGFGNNGHYYAIMLAIYTKDGRYKYVVDQIAYSYKQIDVNGSIVSTYHDSPEEPVESWGSPRVRAGYVDSHVAELLDVMQKLADTIKVAMTTGATPAKSDW